MTSRILLFLALLCIPLASHAQAYKCKMPDGKIVISNEGCANGGRLEQITTAAPVTYDRWRQAAEVNARANRQLDGMARENAAYNEKIRQQQTAQAAIDHQNAIVSAKQSAQDNQKRCLDDASRLSGRAKSRMVAACMGTHYEEPQRSMPPHETTQPPQPLPVIKNCNGNSCTDQMGNRYTETAGKITNSNGQRCYQRGKVMYCD